MPTGTGSQDRCCHRAAGRKRYSGTVIIVFATIATIAMTIVAIAASAVPLYSAFGWINVILNVTVLVTASIFVCRCCECCCGDEGCRYERCLQLVRGIMMVYCVLAIISLIVCASGADAAVRHNCEGKVKCDSAVPFAQLYFWNRDCGQKTSRFQLCTGPETGGGHLYYSKWGDDCHDGGGHDDACRAFATEKDCWNYCNPHDDDMDATDQCDGADDPDRCNDGSSIHAHAHLLAFWSSIAIVVLLVPSVIWTFCLFQPDPPKPSEPPTVQAVEMATVQVRAAHAAAPTVVLQAAPPPQLIYAPQPQTGQVIYAQEEPVKGSSEGGVVL